MGYKSGSSLGQNREGSLSGSRQKATDPLFHTSYSRFREILFLFTVDGEVFFPEETPCKTLGRSEDRQETDSKKQFKRKRSFTDTGWDSPVRYLGLKKTTINIRLLKSWACGGKMFHFFASLQIPSLWHQWKCRLALLWRFIMCGGHFESEVPESLTFPSQVSPCCACKCQSSFFTAVRTD